MISFLKGVPLIKKAKRVSIANEANIARKGTKSSKFESQTTLIKLFISTRISKPNLKFK